jgi:hypothetical protein
LVPEISIEVRPGKQIEATTPWGKVFFEQPVFRSTQITTTVQMQSGTTILLGVGDDLFSEEAKGQVTLMFLTAAVTGVD